MKYSRGRTECRRAHCADTGLLRFRAYPAVTDSDRDKYCIHRIFDFYKRHQVNLADYFVAAVKHKNRGAKLEKANWELKQFAAEASLMREVFGDGMVGAALTECARPMPDRSRLCEEWKEIGTDGKPDAASESAACTGKDFALKLRKSALKPVPPKLEASGGASGRQPGTHPGAQSATPRDVTELTPAT